MAQKNYGEAEALANSLETTNPSSPAVAAAQALLKTRGEPAAEVGAAPTEPPAAAAPPAE